MATVEIIVNSKIYQVGCDEEDKERIQACAKNLNDKIESFRNRNPVFFMSLNDEHIFLFQALILVAESQEDKNMLNMNKSLLDKTIEKESEKYLNQIQAKLNSINVNLKKIQTFTK